MRFYLKLSTGEAATMMATGITALFGKTPTKFKQYTSYIEDAATGDKYWCVENVQYDGVLYDVEGYVLDNYSSLTRYSQEFVQQFIPEPNLEV